MDLVDLGTVLGLAMAVGLVPWLWSGIAELGGPARATVRKTRHCPLDGRRVTVTRFAAPPRDVSACTAFAQPSHVQCTKVCLTPLTVIRNPNRLSRPKLR